MIPSFEEQILRALADVLGDTSAGLTGTKISQLLAACGIDDLSLSTTKRHRLYDALAARQERDRCANLVGHFIIQAMQPVRYLKNPEAFEQRRLQVNSVLAFAGLAVSKRGQLEPVDAASTILEAQGPPPETVRQSSGHIGPETIDGVRRQSELLLAMFDELMRAEDHQRRGYFLQDLLNRLFVVHGIPVVRSFTRNQGAEQIDGAFTLDGWYYLVECRWREKVADTRQLDGLLGQVGRSGKQTMGLFLRAVQRNG